MSIFLADRTKVTTTTTGTGTLTLGSAVAGFQSFTTAGADGKTLEFCTDDGTNWEVARGVYTASGATLTRVSIIASSNSGSAVSWSAGTKTVALVGSSALLQRARSNGLDTAPGVPSTEDDEALSDTSANWTWENQGSSTLAIGDGCIDLNLTTGAKRGIYKNMGASGANWIYRCKAYMPPYAGSGDTAIGMYLRESGTGKVYAACVMVASTASASYRMPYTGASLSAASYGSYVTDADWKQVGPFYIELARSGSNFSAKVGRTWKEMFTIQSSVALTTPFTTAPDQIGLFGVNDSSGVTRTYSFAWFRRYA